jgi:hypothetical protein
MTTTTSGAAAAAAATASKFAIPSDANWACLLELE